MSQPHSRSRILLGVGAGIAAYKAAELVRRLRERDAEVQVVMTAGATRFVTPLTFQALSGRAVRDSLWDDAAEAAMGHIELARWASHILVAPATADLLARLAHGQADDLLTTLCLASAAPLSVAPAMNRQMWAHPATQANISTLRQRGVRVLGPADGSQACGETGSGRMLEPAELTEQLLDTASATPGLLRGLRILITAGPTFEDIDPVRYLGNRSSGRMGFAVAEAAVEAGAEVTLIAGPVQLPTPGGVHRIDVRSAREMQVEVRHHVEGQHVFIAAAAVADYRPADPKPEKIKKSAAVLDLPLVRNPDILTEVAERQSPPFTVGFAAETGDVARYARDKLVRKKLDMVAANQVGLPGQGFDCEDNAMTVFWADGEREIPRASKQQVARQLLRIMVERRGGAR